MQLLISAPILPNKPKDHDQPIHIDPVNILIMILRFYGKLDQSWKFPVQSLDPFEIMPFRYPMQHYTYCELR